MVDKARYRFTEVNPRSEQLSLMPYLPITLTHQERSFRLAGLLDTGSSVNVLPYEVGLELGLVWERQTITIPLTGNLAQTEARVVLIQATVDRFAPVNLAFAWIQDRNAPLILGQTNFFQSFDVCFYRADSAFEVSSR